MRKNARDRDQPKHLTPAVFHTLLVLTDGPLHGYAISQEVERATEGEVRMGPGTMYGSLQRMQTAGLVERVESVQATGSHADRRRYYSLTQEGRAACEVEARRLAKAVDLARSRAVLDHP